MDERLRAKQAALSLVLQDVSSEELGQMLWNLGYSNARFSSRADLDRRMEKIIRLMLPGSDEHKARIWIPHEVIQVAHTEAKRRITGGIGEAMSDAARAMVQRYYDQHGNPIKDRIDVILIDKS